MPNALGIYDLSGNVWEWCEDDYGKDSYKKTPANMLNPVCIGGEILSLDRQIIVSKNRLKSTAYRVLRGGGWLHDSEGCRLLFRFNGGAGLHYSGIGFRLLGLFSGS